MGASSPSITFTVAIGSDCKVASDLMVALRCMKLAMMESNVSSHHRESNLEDNPNENPFISHRPERMTHVDVDEPGCPLNEEQIVYLNYQLNSLPYINTRNMDSYRLIWISALRICDAVFAAE